MIRYHNHKDMCYGLSPHLMCIVTPLSILHCIPCFIQIMSTIQSKLSRVVRHRIGTSMHRFTHQSVNRSICTQEHEWNLWSTFSFFFFKGLGSPEPYDWQNICMRSRPLRIIGFRGPHSAPPPISTHVQVCKLTN